MAFAACEWPGRFRGILRLQGMRSAVANLALWGVGFLVLHQAVGYKPPTFRMETALQNNREAATYALVLNDLLFGPAWILIVMGLRKAPRVILRAARLFGFARADWPLV